MLVAGERDTRGEPSPPPPVAADAAIEVRPTTQLVITLTPAQPERDALVRLVLVRGDRAALLEPASRRNKDGSLTIEAPAAELLGAQADGAVALVALLGRELPSDDEIRSIALGRAALPSHVQRLRQALRLAGFSRSAIEVLIGGCRGVISGTGSAPPRCELAAGAPLKLWLGVAPSDEVEIFVDDQLQRSAVIARGGGAAYELPVAVSARALSVRVGGVEVAARQLAEAPRFASVQAFDLALDAGSFDQAEAALAAAASAATAASAAEQLELARRRARLAARRGEPERARVLRQQAVALAREQRNLSVETDELVALLYGLIDDHQLAEAAQLARQLDAHGTLYAEGAMYRELTRGRLASELGDLGTALSLMRHAQAIGERLGSARGLAVLRGPLADVLLSLGRGEEVRQLAEAEASRGAQGEEPCARVDALTSAGWLLRDVDRPRAQQLVDRAAALAEERCADRLPIALVNRGWLLAEAGQFGAARAVLKRLARAPREGVGRAFTWELRLEAEVLLGEDPEQAARHAGQLLERAEALCSTEQRYEAHLLRARALHALHRPAEAAAAFAEAERALARWSRTVPLGEGRETFFRRHDQLALAAIPFFLEQLARGDAAAKPALAATVRRSLARFVASLAFGGRVRSKAERGERPAQLEPALLADASAPPLSCAAREAALALDDEPPLSEPPTHAALLVHPAPGGWLLVAWRGAAIELASLPTVEHEPPAALTARLTAAAAPLFAGVARLHLHVHRSLAALPLDRSLMRALPAATVAFAVDAPAPPSAAAACSAAPRALLVSDPQRNLWAASDAVPALRAQLERRGFTVELLEGAAVTRAALAARLADPCVQLLHYDGHARGRSAPSGAVRDRVDDALLLAGGETLTAAEILGLPRVPPAIVLNGCTTAAPEGLGLAQAFLVAGAAQVVASLEELPSEDAAQFTRLLYAPAPAPAETTTTGAASAALDLVSLFARAMASRDLAGLRAFER
jgi:cellulose synthase operon protein C